MEAHECNKISRRAIRIMDDDFYGPAILCIEKRDGRWLAHNDEYASVILYCPFCGKKLD